MLKRILLIATVLASAILLNVSAQPATDTDRIVHVLNRAGYGPRPGDVDKVRRIGVDQYIEAQLHPDMISDSAVEKRLSSFDTLRSDTAAIRARYQRDPRPVVEQLQAQKIIRAVYSERQLQEVMTDFWFNHFNVDASRDGVQFAITSYERDAIRPNALGKFKDLLRATAKHPAMLAYLDNAKSSAAGINENYARELLELHTLGVNGGYLQKDVEAVARCFSGWTIDASGSAFEFRPSLHVPGDKVVLENSIPSGGYDEAEKVLEILSHHPSTAHFIATKLVKRFVDDKPSATLVSKVARVFTDTGGDTAAMLRTIFNSDEFLSEKTFRSKVKSPFEVVVSAMRAVNANLEEFVSDQQVQGTLRGLPEGDIVLLKTGGARIRVSPAVILTRTIQDMGQFPYQYSEPSGYPDRGDFWMGDWAVLHRTNFAVSLVNNQILGTTVNASRLVGSLPKADGSWKAALAVLISPVEQPNPLSDVFPTSAAVEAFALALGSPEFQRR